MSIQTDHELQLDHSVSDETLPEIDLRSIVNTPMPTAGLFQNGSAAQQDPMVMKESSAHSTSKVRLLLLSQIIPPAIGGTAKYPYEIVVRLAGIGAIVGGHHHNLAEAEEYDNKQQVKILRTKIDMSDTGMISWRGFKNYVRLLWFVYRTCRREKIDAIWCTRCIPEGWVAWLLKKTFGIPYILSAHGEEVKLPSPGLCERGVMTSRQHQWMGRRVIPAAIAVVANSTNTRTIVHDEWGVCSDRLSLIYPGVDTDYFQPVPRDEAIRTRLGWQGKIVLLTIGRLVQRKGHDRMIEALQQIRAAHPNVLYAIVGNGPERKKLEKLVETHGLSEHVQFHGELNDSELLTRTQQCDLFVLPNRQVGTDIEGFGMVLLEAQACGKPVVAGRSGGTSETMLVSDGQPAEYNVPETGCLVDCNQPDEIARTIIHLLNNPGRLQQMGNNGPEHVKRRFGWATLTEQTERMIEQLSIRVRERRPTGQTHCKTTTQQA